MKKDILAFIAGLTTGVILGLLVRDKDKKMVQDALANQVHHLRNKYEELSKEGKELMREGIDKVKGMKKEYLG
ncbi:MAG: hypothetical protein BGO68_02470 [Candidatus Amoebophilus sp. 36-38]|nr:MAG: hypothetical protein BGO68_02470 [Candidatus Amoebophilus sp. 36-38]